MAYQPFIFISLCNTGIINLRSPLMQMARITQQPSILFVSITAMTVDKIYVLNQTYWKSVCLFFLRASTLWTVINY
jgi:hypothetical protein